MKIIFKIIAIIIGVLVLSSFMDNFELHITGDDPFMPVFAWDDDQEIIGCLITKFDGGHWVNNPPVWHFIRTTEPMLMAHEIKYGHTPEGYSELAPAEELKSDTLYSVWIVTKQKDNGGINFMLKIDKDGRAFIESGLNYGHEIYRKK